MGYIVKLIENNEYFIPDSDGDIDTTQSRNEAIATGQFDDYESAKETAESWSGDMVLGRDFIIETVPD